MAAAHPISEKLIAWYKNNQRDLPWRKTKDPYKIWLSEIMLQQTQVIQGMSYYLKFTEEFPTIKDLAKAPEDKVMKLWQGLGYYSRARNLHETARYIAKEYQGKFPETFEQIRALKGIGDYTAAAISSMAFDLPYAVVDGNVYRVLSRVFNLHTPINSSKGKQEFQKLANEILNIKKPALHNNAIMELGAIICKPQNPSCTVCPIQIHCSAFQHQTTNLLPIKDKKLKVKNRYFHYIIFNHNDAVYIRKRTQKDIWQNLYEFYLIETKEAEAPQTILKRADLKKITSEFSVLSVTPHKKHMLSHQNLHAVFYELKIKRKPQVEGLIKIKRKHLTDYALPQLINKYLESI